MKIYLASRYSRRLELCGHRETLRALGHTVTARWLDGNHQISDAGEPIGEDGERLVEDGDDGSKTARAARLRTQFAAEDCEDVHRCDLLIAFTEVPRSGHSRGGRHVELGMALGLHKLIAIVGPRENVFCWLPQVFQYERFEHVLAELSSVERVAACAAVVGTVCLTLDKRRWEAAGGGSRESTE